MNTIGFLQQNLYEFKQLFLFWNFFDTTLFFAIMIPLVFLFVSQRIAFQLFYITTLSLIINKILKYTFMMPRPSQIDPTIGMLHPETPAFPSGAAQTAAILAGIVFVETKNRYYRILILLFSAVLCLSRVYLGVHFPMDIVGGLFVGSLLVLVYKYVFPLYNLLTYKQKIIVLSLFPLVTLPFFPLIGLTSIACGFALIYFD